MVTVGRLRCELAECANFYSRGIGVRPLANLGIAIPLGKPDFGFPRENSTVNLSATTGLQVVGFAYQGDLDIRILLGVTNGVGTDGVTATPGVLTGIGIGVWRGLFTVSYVGVVNPGKGTEWGHGLAFAIDLVAIKGALKDASNGL